MDEAPSSSSFSSSSASLEQSFDQLKEERSPCTGISSVVVGNHHNFIQEQGDESKIIISGNDSSIDDSSGKNGDVSKGGNVEDKGMEVEQENGTASGDKDITTVDGMDSVSKSSDRREEDDELEDDDDDGNASTGMDLETDLRECDNNHYTNIRSMERMSSVDTFDEQYGEDIETEKVEDKSSREEDGTENKSLSTIGTPELKVDVPKTEEEQIAEDIASMLPVSPDAIPSLPILRGNMITEGNPEEGGKAVYIFKGIWALSEKAHNNGNTANFEYTQVQPNPSSSVCYSGKYSGHFYLKQGKNLVKHDDIVDMKFESVEGNPNKVYDIIGNGKNSFGKFLIQGEMKEDHSMAVYKIYLAATPKPRSKRSDTPKVHTPRESTPRQIKERQILEMPAVRSSSGSKKEKEREEKAKAKALIEAEKAGTKERLARELEDQLQLCKDLLAEMMDLPNAKWFLKPVDPIRMHLPDYFSVVKQPMDMGTVKLKFSSDSYETPEAFCSDMRLIFRNAMMYNHQKDNPVHVAAKDMHSRFEEKFRSICGKYNSSSLFFGPQTGKPTSLLKKTSASRGSSGGVHRSSSSSSVQRMKTPNGPRTPNGQQYTPIGPPGALESEAIAEMSTKMAQMQQEMIMLRTALIFPELIPEVALTKEEQATLVDQIHSLSPDKMDIVIEIIQANAFDNKALYDGKYNDYFNNISGSGSSDNLGASIHADPDSSKDKKKDECSDLSENLKDEDDDTIKIPLHALDIKTLRSLQRYVQELYIEDQAEKKHRKSSGGKKRGAKELNGEQKPTKSPKLKSTNHSTDIVTSVSSSDVAMSVETSSDQHDMSSTVVGQTDTEKNLDENVVAEMSQCEDKQEVTVVGTDSKVPLLKVEKVIVPTTEGCSDKETEDREGQQSLKSESTNDFATSENTIVNSQSPMGNNDDAQNS